MKKAYQKPEALVELVELEQLMGASIIEGVDADPELPTLGREFPVFNDVIDEE
ncbi:MAG: hypothetical protein K6A32_02055 [Bacteroidales bacterium]|nr:hypothetical protein [Bacteroidales bacterium]